jgi:hypothetical protein
MSVATDDARPLSLACCGSSTLNFGGERRLSDKNVYFCAATFLAIDARVTT